MKINTGTGENSLDELIMERFALAKERIMEIPEENAVPEPYCDFFRKEAQFLQKTFEVLR